LAALLPACWEFWLRLPWEIDDEAVYRQDVFATSLHNLKYFLHSVFEDCCFSFNFLKQFLFFFFFCTTTWIPQDLRTGMDISTAKTG
jgi:hypothetical protein